MKRQRYKMKSRLSGVIAMTLFLAGCGSAGAQETPQDGTEPETVTVISLDLEDRTPGVSAAGEGQGADDADMAGNAADQQAADSAEDWGLSFGESGTQPTGNAAPEDLAWYDAYFMGDDSEKVIYLTFDCGYENGNTAPILDALKKHNAPAAFFVVGHFLETAPDMVKRMVAEGHAVGNHTYHHPDM